MYLDFYNLQAPPFQLTSDRSLFFAAPQFVRALQELSPDRARDKGFRVITGEVGVGKSMLCYVMRADLERSNACVAHLVTSQVGPDDLLRMVAAQLGIYRANGGPGAVLAEIRDFVIQCGDAGRRVVLFIDEAQNLPKPSFKALCSLMDLEFDGRPPMEIFLIGQPEFRRALASGAMKKVRRSLVSAHHLMPLSAGETRDFIVHRLRMAGWRDDPSFSEEAFDTIYRLTGGVPRRINVFCNRLLIDTHLKGLHEIDSGFVLQVVRDSRTEQLPIGGLSFDENLLSYEEAVPGPDRSGGTAAEGPAALLLEHFAAVGTWLDRNAARIGNVALWVAAPLLVSLIVYSAINLFGPFEGGGRVAVVVKLPPISQFEIDQLERQEAAGPLALDPTAPVPLFASHDAAREPTPEARKPFVERLPPSDRALAFAARAEPLLRVKAPGLDTSSSQAAGQPPGERWAPPVPDPPAERPAARVKPGSLAAAKQVVASEPEAGRDAGSAPLRLVPEAMTPQQSDPPESAGLDAALPGPVQPARTNSPTRTNPPTRSDSPTRSSPPTRARSLDDFVRGSSPAAPERVAQVPRLTLIDFVLTRAVVDREPVDDVETLAVADEQAFAFARIENPGPAAKVTFVWYQGDEVQSNVDLDVKTSARWRTWSAATLEPGSWRVQLLSSDREVLGERLFVVEP